MLAYSRVGTQMVAAWKRKESNLAVVHGPAHGYPPRIRFQASRLQCRLLLWFYPRRRGINDG